MKKKQHNYANSPQYSYSHPTIPPRNTQLTGKALMRIFPSFLAPPALISDHATQTHDTQGNTGVEWFTLLSCVNVAFYSLVPLPESQFFPPSATNHACIQTPPFFALSSRAPN